MAILKGGSTIGGSRILSLSDATNLNTAGRLVQRDANGNFSAGVATLTGLIATTINNLTLTAATTGFTIAGGTTSKTLTVSESMTLTGDAARTLTINNANKTLAGAATALTFAGNFTTTGAFTTTLAQGANVTLTLPTTNSTLATTANINNGTLNLGVSGVGLSGSATFTANQSTASTFTVTSNATSANTANAIVSRDGSGNFSAGNITLTGDIAVNGGDITTTATTFKIGNTATTSHTTDISTAATASGQTKTINIGTGGVAGSLTNVNIGSLNDIVERAFTLTEGSAVITGANTANIVVGQSIAGPGIPNDTNVVSLVASTSVTMSNSATSSGLETLKFGGTKVTIAGALDVIGNTTLRGKLTVEEDADFKANVNINGSLDVKESITAGSINSNISAIQDNKLFLRVGATEELGVNEFAGLVAVNADGNSNAALLFDGNGSLKIGDVDVLRTSDLITLNASTNLQQFTSNATYFGSETTSIILVWGGASPIENFTGRFGIRGTSILKQYIDYGIQLFNENTIFYESNSLKLWKPVASTFTEFDWEENNSILYLEEITTLGSAMFVFDSKSYYRDTRTGQIYKKFNSPTNGTNSTMILTTIFFNNDLTDNDQYVAFSAQLYKYTYTTDFFNGTWTEGVDFPRVLPVLSNVPVIQQLTTGNLSISVDSLNPRLVTITTTTSSNLNGYYSGDIITIKNNLEPKLNGVFTVNTKTSTTISFFSKINLVTGASYTPSDTYLQSIFYISDSGTKLNKYILDDTSDVVVRPPSSELTQGGLALWNGESGFKRIENRDDLVYVNQKLGVGVALPRDKIEVDGVIRFSGIEKIHLKEGFRTLLSTFEYGINPNSVTPTGYNLFLGPNAGNTRMGQTATSSIESSNNIGIGYEALRNTTTGYRNTAIGFQNLWSNSSGHNNMAIGFNALNKNQTGSSNIALGSQALRESTSGFSNIGIGSDTLFANTSGSRNVGIGQRALTFITGSSNYNVALGDEAGTHFVNTVSLLTEANNSTFLGSETKASANGNTNETVVGYRAVGNGSNTVTIGNSSVTNNYFSGTVNAATLTLSSTSPTLTTTASGAKTANFISNVINATATSSTASLTKTGLNIQSTGTWNGTSAVNRALLLNATGGTINRALEISAGDTVLQGMTATTGAFSSTLSATSPRFTTSINDSNGNEVIAIGATASAVNELSITNAATANAVTLSTSGGDTNIGLNINTKGTGTITLGNATNINSNLGIRAAATASTSTQIPVFIADPTSTTRTLVTRTPAQLRSDIGAQVAGSYLTSESDTLATVTGRGNTTTTDISIANLILNNAADRTISIPAVTGTNIPGKTLTVSSGAGTGTGAISTISFQTPTIGTTGTTAQTLANRMTINSSGVTIPGNLTVSGTVTINNVDVINTSSGIIFDGATANANKTTLNVVDPTAARSILLPNASGTVALTSDLHTRSHTMTSTSDHTAGNWKVFYSNGSGQVIELALAAANQYLKSNGVSAAPSFAQIAYSEISGTPTIPTGFNISAGATDGLFDITGTGGTNSVSYAVAPYSSKQTTLQHFYTGTTNPTVTTRLNLDAALYATQLYDGGSRVLTAEADTLATVTGRGATTATAMSLTNATASTTTGNGALIVTGGVGVGGNLNIGGNLSVTGSNNIGQITGANTKLGFEALNSVDTTTNRGNTAIGHQALKLNTTGEFNTATGWLALSSNIGGSGNTAYGLDALLSNTTGNNNTAIGALALSENIGGSGNLAYGSEAGRLTISSTANSAGSNSIFIGNQTRASSNTQTNQIVIGHNTAGNGSDTVTIGNSSIVETFLRGTVYASSGFSGNGASLTSLNASNISSGTLAVARGGTGQTTLALARNAMGLGNTTGAVPIANGGTGATTAAAARDALGLGNTTGALPVANGGTGTTSHTSGNVLIGAGTGAITSLSRSGIDSRSTFPIATTISSETTFTNGVRSGSGTQSWQIESTTNDLLFRSGSSPTTRMIINNAGTITGNGVWRLVRARARATALTTAGSGTTNSNAFALLESHLNGDTYMIEVNADTGGGSATAANPKFVIVTIGTSSTTPTTTNIYTTGWVANGTTTTNTSTYTFSVSANTTSMYFNHKYKQLNNSSTASADTIAVIELFVGRIWKLGQA